MRTVLPAACDPLATALITRSMSPPTEDALFMSTRVLVVEPMAAVRPWTGAAVPMPYVVLGKYARMMKVRYNAIMIGRTKAVLMVPHRLDLLEVRSKRFLRTNVRIWRI